MSGKRVRETANGATQNQANGLLQQIEVEIAELVGTKDELLFRSGVVLLSAAVAVGPDIDALAAFTGYSKDLIAGISQRMYHAGVWEGEVVHTIHWFPGDKEGPIGLLLDLLVAKGELLAKRREDGEFVYRGVRAV